MTMYRSKDPIKHKDKNYGILSRGSLLTCIRDTLGYIEKENNLRISHGHNPCYCGDFYVEDAQTGEVVYRSNFKRSLQRGRLPMRYRFIHREWIKYNHNLEDSEALFSIVEDHSYLKQGFTHKTQGLVQNLYCRVGLGGETNYSDYYSVVPQELPSYEEYDYV